MDDELRELGGSLVAVATVPNEEFYQVAELFDGEVGGERGLTAFFSDDADTDVGGLDHGYVVAAVADAAYAFLGVLTDQESDVGLLGGGATTGDYGGKEDGNRDELFAVVG